MTFTESLQTCFNKYIDFNGRASRSEYWWFILLNFGLSFIPIIGWILRLAILLPTLAVQVRRLHDMGHSAWWLLLLVPPITIFGLIVLLIMSIFSGTPGPNHYGRDPLQQMRDTWQGDAEFGYDQASGTFGQPPPTVGYGAAIDTPPRTQTAPDIDPGPTERRYCTECGTQLQPDARFCTFCGTGS